MVYTVVTTVFNDQDKVKELLNEMTQQEREPKKIIIVDGGSSDRTVEQIKEFQKNSKICIQLEAEKGKRFNISEGFNRAIQLANTELVGIVAVGNHYPTNFFKVLIQGMEKDTELDAAYSVIKGKSDTQFAQIYSNSFWGLGKKSKAPTNHGVLIKKNIIEEYGYFYEGFYYAGEDSHLYEEIMTDGKKCECIEGTSVYWEVPKNWKEYLKQNRVYMIGGMQSYSNKVFFRVYRNQIGYVALWFIGVICVGVFKSKLIGMSILLLCMLCNTKLILKKGIKCCFLRNADYFITVYHLIRECKYFLNQNKIDKSRRLYKTVWSTNKLLGQRMEKE